MATEEGQCFSCRIVKGRKELKRCGKCLSAVYCSPACQKTHWPDHKLLCVKPGGFWYDKHRSCRDGSAHQGKLELVTWRGKDETGQSLGWGSILLEEEADHKRKFRHEYAGNEAKFYKYWPQGFRWTCCGVPGDTNYGCDHHSAAFPQPCTCDFCRMGKPLPERIFRRKTQHNQGLTLARGPDPRSYNAEIAAINIRARRSMGLEL